MARRNGTRNRRGSNQTEALISYIEQHSLFARGQICKLGAQGHIKYKKMWNDLSNLLNRIGPSHKDVATWQKSWTQMRLNAKTNKAKFMKEMAKTGHNAHNYELSEIDCRVSQIYGKYGTGMNLGKELGFHRIQHPNSEEDEINSEEDEFSFDSLLSLSLNCHVTEPVQSFLDCIPSRINDTFEELCQNLFHFHENTIKWRGSATKASLRSRRRRGARDTIYFYIGISNFQLRK
ncbi:uncharacterized protein LOC116738634 isoform X2 [Nasonia vitripennis]|uniref:Regulatory protein zeste n=1 Tax=Nasonia vitripennis TaxID=7425 RepID=A0A7M7R2N6_NASVI|nr:uncharacterized protein LOC116738634 isoform X2 [Nasonia vitripennis]